MDYLENRVSSIGDGPQEKEFGMGAWELGSLNDQACFLVLDLCDQSIFLPNRIDVFT